MYEFDNAIIFKLKSIALSWYLQNFLEKDETGLLFQIKPCMIRVYRAYQLKRFAPFSYLNHSSILSLKVKVCIRLIIFLLISLYFSIC